MSRIFAAGLFLLSVVVQMYHKLGRELVFRRSTQLFASMSWSEVILTWSMILIISILQANSYQRRKLEKLRDESTVRTRSISLIFTMLVLNLYVYALVRSEFYARYYSHTNVPQTWKYSCFDSRCNSLASMPWPEVSSMLL